MSRFVGYFRFRPGKHRGLCLNGSLISPGFRLAGMTAIPPAPLTAPKMQGLEPDSSLSSSLLLMMSISDPASSTAHGPRLANIPGIARRSTHSRIARTKTPEAAVKENALRDLLIGVDG